MLKMIINLIIILTFISTSICDILPTTIDYSRSLALLDKKFHVFWKYDDTAITFEVHAKTLGWVGFGLSPNGGMAGSDVTITWIKDGQTFFSDRHALANYEPVVDDSQDWTLISAQESDEYTIIVMTRQLVTDDPSDMCIRPETMKIIYAFSPKDPSSDSDSLRKHTVRGSRNVQLLSPSRKEPKLPDDAFSYDIVMTKGRLRPLSGDTFQTSLSLEKEENATYWCEAIKVPPLNNTKHHVIMYEPAIEEGHEELVHHIIVFGCFTKRLGQYTTKDLEGHSSHCLTENDAKMKVLLKCETMMFVWSRGGNKFWLPDKVGFALGDEDSPSLFIIQIHYQNPHLTTDIIDHSGVRIWLTPTLRDHDGAILTGGMPVGWSQIVPPGSDGFLTQGICHGDCIAEALSANNQSNIRVFAALLHAHITATDIKVRHIRDGVELQPILEGNNLDANFEEFVLLPKEVIIQPKDHILTQCAYQTKDRMKLTLGGLALSDEMCLTPLMYYPKIPLAKCQSSPSFTQLSRFMTNVETRCFYRDGQCIPFITKPKSRYTQTIVDYAQSIEWTQSYRDRLQRLSTEGEIALVCGHSHDEVYKSHTKVAKVPDIFIAYKDNSRYAFCPSTFNKLNFPIANGKSAIPNLPEHRQNILERFLGKSTK